MSRSGYSDDYDQWALICYRGQVASAIMGKRGQAFLREMLAAIDKRGALVANAFHDQSDRVCALGAVGKDRGVDMPLGEVDNDDSGWIAKKLGIAQQLAAEIMYENDEGAMLAETSEQRYDRMRKWIVSKLIEWDKP